MVPVLSGDLDQFQQAFLERLETNLDRAQERR